MKGANVKTWLLTLAVFIHYFSTGYSIRYQKLVVVEEFAICFKYTLTIQASGSINYVGTILYPAILLTLIF